MNFGFGEILLVLIIILVLFGAKKVPEIGRSLGTAMREFKKSMSGDEEPQNTQKEPVISSHGNQK